jgi:hypothetical protein
VIGKILAIKRILRHTIEKGIRIAENIKAMADRENVKIVLSAALIAIVASLGIYAFIYREKISQMLPNWQAQGKILERTIDSARGISESEANSTDPGQNPSRLPEFSDPALEEEAGWAGSPGAKSGLRDEAIDYPEIPVPVPNAASAKTEYSGEGNLGKGRVGAFDSPKPTKTEIDSPPKKESLVIQNQDLPKATNSVSNLSPGKDSPKKQAPISTKPKVNLEGKSTKSSASKSMAKQTQVASSAKIKSSSSPKTQKTSSGYSPSSSGSSKSLSQEERIKRLERKFDIHVQDTNTRLESIERRIERLERRTATTGQ